MPSPRVEVAPDAWPLQDRGAFLAWVKDTFRYSAPSPSNDDGKVGDGRSGETAARERRSLFVQQKFVRDYLQRDSPYRGLLLLHSLGVGKTCAAITAAEALRAGAKSVIVMTTRMLRGSFASEVPSCVSPELERNQPWRLVADPSTDPVAAERAALLPRSMVKKHGGVWVAASASDGGEVPATTYERLEPRQQAHVDAQIDAVVSSSFRFVHYNGLTRAAVDRMCAAGNPFDDAVVIIDEVHNFVSRVMNMRVVAPLYERLLDAVRCKVILLSGTPIVNRTAELAFLINLVQGRTLVHVLRLRGETTQEAVDAALADRANLLQLKEYDPADSVVRVVFLPHGFEMLPDRPGMVRRRRPEEGRDAGGDYDISEVVRLLNRASIRVQSHRALATLPLPDDVEAFDARFVDWEQGVLSNPGLLQRRLIGSVSAYDKHDPGIFARVSGTEIVQAPMSGLQFIKYAQVRAEERRRERNVQRLLARAGFNKKGRGGGGGGAEENTGQVYRMFSLALCTFVFPDEIPRPFKFQMRARAREDAQPDPSAEDLDRDYRTQMEAVTRRLVAEMPETLKRSGSLGVHSPKFARLLDRLDASPGPVLVYSQFRRAEGLGLLSAVLDANGWAELRLRKAGDAWVHDDRRGHGDDDGDGVGGQAARFVDRPRYVILRTEEDPECNRILRNIFNNELDEIPRVTRDSLPRSDTNLRGEIARAYMITAAGAEGISLRNVRQVHMLEGFWNHNRLDQVIGRAVRARSHLQLPPEERSVDVFLYLATFTDDQRSDHGVMRNDKGLSSDEHVHAVAMKKKALTDQAIALIKAAASDCAVHDGGRACLRMPAGLAPGARTRSFAFDDDLTDEAWAKRATKLVPVQVDGVRRFMDPSTGALYDYDKLKSENVLVKVGEA